MNTGATWSPDGKLIAYDSASRGNTDLWIMNADGSVVEALLDYVQRIVRHTRERSADIPGIHDQLFVLALCWPVRLGRHSSEVRLVVSDQLTAEKAEKT